MIESEGQDKVYHYKSPHPAVTTDCCILAFNAVAFKMKKDKNGDGRLSF